MSVAAASTETLTALDLLIQNLGPAPPDGAKLLKASTPNAEALLQAGLASKSGRKLTLTPKGWTQWLADADDAQQAEVFVQALRLIDERDGKKLTKPQAEWAEPHLIACCIADELIEKVKTGVYALTEPGRHYLLANLPESEGEILRRVWREREETLIAELLRTVQSRDGKALTKAQQQKFDAAVRRAADDSLIESGRAKGAWSVTDAGSEWLFSRLSADEQFAELDARRKHLEHGLRAVGTRIKADLKQTPDGVSAPLRDAAEELSSALQADIERLSDHLSPLRSLVDSAAVLKAIGSEIRERVTDVEQQAVARSKDHEADRRNAASAIESEQARLGQRLQEVSERLERFERTASVQKAESNNTSAAVPTLDDVRTAYAKLREQHFANGGIVNIAELHALLARSGKSLPLSEYHDLLLRWRASGDVTLQVCNNASSEPDSAAGIPTDRGLLFYIRATPR